MNPYFRRMKPLLGTYVEMGCLKEEKSFSFEQAFGKIELIQNLLSFHDVESELSLLNSQPGKALTLHPQTIRVLKLAKAFSVASGGNFNPTVGGELEHLGFLPLSKNMTDENPLRFGNHSDIVIEGRKAFLKRPVKVVLDGIAKGYAVDLGIAAMKQSGFTAGWINAGGDMKAFGRVQLPVHRRNSSHHLENLGILENMAIATSCVRDNFSREEPGWIVTDKKNRLLPGVYTVLAKHAWRADALTKVAAILPKDEAISTIKKLGGLLL